MAETIGGSGDQRGPPIHRHLGCLDTSVLAGVRRGLSFQTEGGPAFEQIATMFGLFVLALAAVVAIAHEAAVYAVVFALIGFIAIAVLDPIAARRGQAPLFFARLRPLQMAVAVVGLIALLANLLASVAA